MTTRLNVTDACILPHASMRRPLPSCIPVYHRDLSCTTSVSLTTCGATDRAVNSVVFQSVLRLL